eukprot:5813923-Pyramimonas_sp.AAC.2
MPGIVSGWSNGKVPSERSRAAGLATYSAECCALSGFNRTFFKAVKNLVLLPMSFWDRSAAGAEPVAKSLLLAVVTKNVKVSLFAHCGYKYVTRGRPPTP